MPVEALDKAQLLTEAIKKAPNTKDAICLIADVILESAKASQQRFEESKKERKEITTALFGNGDPEKSICSKLDRLATKVNVIFTILGIAGGAGLSWGVVELLKLI